MGEVGAGGMVRLDLERGEVLAGVQVVRSLAGGWVCPGMILCVLFLVDGLLFGDLSLTRTRITIRVHHGNRLAVFSVVGVLLLVVQEVACYPVIWLLLQVLHRIWARSGMLVSISSHLFIIKALTATSSFFSSGRCRPFRSEHECNIR